MEFKQGHTVGIDLGTTFSTLAYLNESGEPVPVANDDDEVETPSLIVLAENKKVLVGPSRTRAAMESPDRVIERIKRHMGDVDFKRTFDGQEVTPEFVNALILKKLRQDAESRIGPIGNAVITVPYYFNDVRRKATEDAGRIAGLNVIDIINEPTAATLAYAWKRGELGSNAKRMERPHVAMVYDLGGGTFDVTLVKYTPLHFQVLATDGDTHLGGVDWNDRLADYVAKEFKAKFDLDPRESEQTMQILRNDCDLAKIALSSSERTTFTCRHGGKAMTVSLSREQFQEITADLLQRTIDTANVVLEQASMTVKDLDAVVLVGGSTLMPAVAKAIEDQMGHKPFTGMSPHTSVAQGAAIHAAILDIRNRGEDSEQSERIRKMLANVQQDDVNSHGLGVLARSPKSGKMINNLMIKKNTRLPVEAKKNFATSEPGQQRVSVKVLEGDAPDPEACSMLGSCRITNLPPDLPKGSPIEVCYRIDKSGRVRVSANEKTSGKEVSIEIDRRGGLSEKQIDSFTSLATSYVVE
jgi:molecular chaperone DnaK